MSCACAGAAWTRPSPPSSSVSAERRRKGWERLVGVSGCERPGRGSRLPRRATLGSTTLQGASLGKPLSLTLLASPASRPVQDPPLGDIVPGIFFSPDAPGPARPCTRSVPQRAAAFAVPSRIPRRPQTACADPRGGHGERGFQTNRCLVQCHATAHRSIHNTYVQASPIYRLRQHASREGERMRERHARRRPDARIRSRQKFELELHPKLSRLFPNHAQQIPHIRRRRTGLRSRDDAADKGGAVAPDGDRPGRERRPTVSLRRVSACGSRPRAG